MHAHMPIKVANHFIGLDLYLFKIRKIFCWVKNKIVFVCGTLSQLKNLSLGWSALKVECRKLNHWAQAVSF